MLRFLAGERGLKNLNVTWKNIVSDYGAASGGTGTASGDYTAFKAFHDFAVGQSGWVGLNLPPTPGSYYGVNGSYSFAANQPFFGIPKLVVMGYGARMNGLHGAAFANNNTVRAPIGTVAAGSRTVTLKDVDDAAIFTEGAMVLIGGMDLQGFGYPPNPHYFEWRRIEDITGAVITLTEPLSNSYRDDWPDYFTGNANELGALGAATIVATLPGWDCEHKLFGIESYKPGQQTYYFMRKAELFDVVNNDNGFIIGAGQDHKIVNQIHTTSNHEVDKLCETALIAEYDGVNNIQIQSSSIGFMHVRGGTRTINGTARRTLIEGGSSTSIVLGPTAYGVSESVVIRNHSFGSTSETALTTGIGGDLTYEGDGVFRWADTVPHQWLVPGAVGYIITADSPFFAHSPFRVLGVTADGTDALIHTTFEGASLPEVDGFSSVGLKRHRCPDLTVENCTGSAEALELSQAGANKPYGSFRKRTLDGTVNNTNFGFTMGRLVHIKVNVVTPYTGVAGTLNLTIGGQFGTYVINPDYTQNRYQDSRINLKVAGERVITPSGVTGAQTGDTNLSNFASALWLPVLTGFGAYIGNGSSPVDISSESAGVRPSVTVEILTDQEIPQG